MKQKQKLYVDLDKKVHTALRMRARREGAPLVAIVRRAIDAELRRESQKGGKR